MECTPCTPCNRVSSSRLTHPSVHAKSVVLRPQRTKLIAPKGGHRRVVTSSAKLATPLTAPQMHQLEYPPFQPLAGSETGSFAFDTISQRLPSILDKVIGDLRAPHLAGSSTEDVCQQLATMQQEMRLNCVVPLLEVPARCAQHTQLIVGWTNECLKAWKQHSSQSTWWGLPWLVVECYMYARIHTILCGAESYGAGFDPFAGQKFATISKSAQSFADVAKAVVGLLERAPGISSPQLKDDLFQVMQYSLWGNKTDLSLLVDAAKVDTTSLALQVSSSGSSPFLIVDEFDAVWQHVSKVSNGPRRIDIVLDNAGLELFCDLCLADYLVTSGLATRVVLHGKTIPWFVSDTLRTDLDAMLDACAGPGPAPVEGWEEVQALARRWEQHLSSGAWQYESHPFWTSPFPFWWMEAASPELYAELQSSSHLLIFKGDLNYRKLAYDCRWPLTTPFTEALGPFRPAPLVTLRTLKADVMSGLQPGQGDVLSRLDAGWMVNGKFGIVQAAL